MSNFRLVKDTVLNSNKSLNYENIESTNTTSNNVVIGNDLQALALEQMNSFSALVYDLNTKYVGYRIYSLIPTGGVIPYAGGSIPNGYLLCDGTAVSRTTYAELFAVIGLTYGSGDGLTTFNLPDLRSRLPLGAGQGAGLSNRVLANTGGQESISQVPPHTHNITDPGHTHTYLGVNSQNAASGADNVAENAPRPTETTSLSTTGITINNTGTNIAGGNVNVMNPFLVLNYLIKY